MARRGKLKPGSKLESTLKGSKKPRCQFVKKEKEGKKWGEQCNNSCEPGRPYCRFHGGRAGRPVITGEHSKYNPTPRNLRERFERASTDPEILNLTKNIALLYAQIWEIADKMLDGKEVDPFATKKMLGLMRQHKDLVAQEMERRIAMGSVLDVSQVLMLINVIYDSVVRNVSDNAARKAIASDLRKLVGEVSTSEVVVQD